MSNSINNAGTQPFTTIILIQSYQKVVSFVRQQQFGYLNQKLVVLTAPCYIKLNAIWLICSAALRW